MVVVTLVAQKNGETFYFDDPIPKVHFMKLISCSLYNSWYTLKKEGSASLGNIKSPGGKSVSKILPGHYNLESVSEEIKRLFKKYKYELETEIYTPVGQLVIRNFAEKISETKPIELDRDFADLLGIDRQLKYITFVKKLTSPTAYFIHCDLIDKEQNLFNGKKSDLLARFDIKGKPFEKVSYHSSQQQVLRDCSTDQHVNSITLSVKDQNGELFDFNGFDMEFELELSSFSFIYTMSSANVLPSAPPEAPLYPVLTEPAGNFRLQKINEIAYTLGNEVAHYRLVAKKYKRAKKFVNWSAAGSSGISAVFSSASFGSALSVIGLPAAVPLGGVGGCFALISSALIIACRKLETKIKKHHEITTLAVSKRDTVNRLLSRALANNDVSSHEFDIILSEFERYNSLKEQVRAKMLRQQSNRKIADVDVKKMEKDIRGRVEAEVLKKIADAASANSR